MRGSRTIRTRKNRAAFLTALAAGNSVATAAEIAGIGRASAYDWRDADLDFANDWDDAVERSVDALEDVARARAVAGSDLLLIFLLRHRRPGTYREMRPSAAVVALSAEDLQILEQGRRIKAMTETEIQEEIDGIEGRRRIAVAARAETDAISRRRGNGRDHG
ncbi:MAG TPA: hypothetical protein VFQ90_19975 [Stellaceae bacterium]|jgi:hypothetical protein|nr:hypothetical protein [Stellaceae bacterium]